MKRICLINPQLILCATVATVPGDCGRMDSLTGGAMNPGPGNRRAGGKFFRDEYIYMRPKHFAPQIQYEIIDSVIFD